jgi:hypothetical protein
LFVGIGVEELKELAKKLRSHGFLLIRSNAFRRARMVESNWELPSM